MRSRAKRITVDLDDPTELQLLTSYLNASGLFGESAVEQYRTGHGYHLRIRVLCESVYRNLNVRRSLNDDPNRIAFDEDRIHDPLLFEWVDTLFVGKERKGKVTGEEPCRILCLPFMSRFPARKGL